MTTQVFLYDIGEKVLVKEIQRPGRIEALMIDFLGVQYRTCYWDNGKRESTWLQAEELEPRNHDHPTT